MSPEELSRIVGRLPLAAPDVKMDIALLFAALTSHCGHLSKALDDLKTSPDDEEIKKRALARYGAAVLVLVAIGDAQGLKFIDAVRAGERELT